MKPDDSIAQHEKLEAEITALIDTKDSSLIGHFFTSNRDALNTLIRGVTPLGMAVFIGDLKTVNVLLDMGADVELSERPQDKPVLVAARSGQLDILKSLVLHGANIHAVTTQGQNALVQVAQRHGSAGWPVAEFLIQHGVDMDILSAVYLERIDDVQRILKTDWIANAAPTTPGDLIYAAVSINSVAILQLLLESGIDPNSTTSHGSPAIFRAVESSCSIELLQLLLKHGASISATDCFGDTILAIADRDPTWISSDKISTLRQHSR